jgi:hypothetical protein
LNVIVILQTFQAIQRSQPFLVLKRSNTVENAYGTFRNVHVIGQERWRVVTLNDQERLGDFKPELSNPLEPVVESFHAPKT